MANFTSRVRALRQAMCIPRAEAKALFEVSVALCITNVLLSWVEINFSQEFLDFLVIAFFVFVLIVLWLKPTLSKETGASERKNGRLPEVLLFITTLIIYGASYRASLHYLPHHYSELLRSGELLKSAFFTSCFLVVLACWPRCDDAAPPEVGSG